MVRMRSISIAASFVCLSTCDSWAQAAPPTPPHPATRKPPLSMQSNILVCTPENKKGAAEATPFSLLVGSDGKLLKVLQAPLVERPLVPLNGMPKEKFLALLSIKGARTLRVVGPKDKSGTLTEWYVFVAPNGKYFEGFWFSGPGNPQNLVFVGPPGSCSHPRAPEAYPPPGRSSPPETPKATARATFSGTTLAATSPSGS